MSIGLEGSSARARHTLSEGEKAFCALSWAEDFARSVDVDDAAARIERTVALLAAMAGAGAHPRSLAAIPWSGRR